MLSFNDQLRLNLAVLDLEHFCSARSITNRRLLGQNEIMNAHDVFADFIQRSIDATGYLPSLEPEQLNAHPAGHPNSVAWLLWHTGREIDVQLSDLSGKPQVWEEFRHRFELGELGESVGYGHTSEQAEQIKVDDQKLLMDYVNSSVRALGEYVASLSEQDLDVVIDDRWETPVTRGVRLVSIVDDATQHIGQAAYAAGAILASN